MELLQLGKSLLEKINKKREKLVEVGTGPRPPLTRQKKLNLSAKDFIDVCGKLCGQPGGRGCCRRKLK